MVGHQECGSLPASTGNSLWYTVSCGADTFGVNVKVVTTQNAPLHFAEIRAVGYPRQFARDEIRELHLHDARQSSTHGVDEADRALDFNPATYAQTKPGP